MQEVVGGAGPTRWALYRSPGETVERSTVAVGRFLVWTQKTNVLSFCTTLITTWKHTLCGRRLRKAHHTLFCPTPHPPPPPSCSCCRPQVTRVAAANQPFFTAFMALVKLSRSCSASFECDTIFLKSDLRARACVVRSTRGYGGREI